MKDCPIFITSADSYSDLFPLFFDLFKKYWPQYNGIIYLNTEQLTYQHEGLNICCTNVGNHNAFGTAFRAGLDKIDSPYVMLMMIDFFFMGNVNDKLINDYFVYFKSKNLDTLCLVKQNYDKSEPLNYKGLHRVVPPSKDMFSYQIAFWKKKKLYEMVLPHENPWLSEWYGTIRANYMQLKLVFTEFEVIPYLPGGALNKGKWAEPMIAFLNNLNYKIDFVKRGQFVDQPASLKARINSRIKTFAPRSLSNLDLLKRKYL